jgi:Mce-associated membrane protein
MSSRNPMPRPRRIAGRTSRSTETPVTEPVARPEEPARDERASRRETPAAPVVEPVAGPEEPARDERASRRETPAADTETHPPRRTFGGQRTTIALVAAIVALVGLGAVLAAYLWGPLQDEPTVSTDTPVLTSEVSHRSAVDAAAAAAFKFTSRSYETYDEDVDAATATMTDAFAEEYRQTTDQVKAEFVDAETVVTAEIAAQAVRTASEEQVEALVFLNQFTEKPGEESVYTPYRVLVTMVDTEKGWLASDVETA